MLTTTVINDLSESSFKDSFLQDFLSSSITTPVFVQRDWLTNWCKTYLRSGDKLFICVHAMGQQTIAYYPLYLKKIALGYELRFIGSGEPENAEVCSEFQDFIIDPTYLQQSLALFTEQVKQLKYCYRIAFDNILENSICYKWLLSYQAAGWQYRKQYIGKRYLLPIADNELLQINQLPQATLRRHARRFVERDDITIEYCQQQQDIPVFFEALVSLHSEQWQKRGKSGAFSSEQFQQFHLKLASCLLQQSNLLLFKLKHDNNTVAIFYGFYHQNTLYYYQSGISTASPLSNSGIGMHLVAMRNARLRGCNHYDLMKGKENSYKTGYVVATQPVYNTNSSLFFYSALTNLKGLLLKIGYQLLKNIRQNRK